MLANPAAPEKLRPAAVCLNSPPAAVWKLLSALDSFVSEFVSSSFSHITVFNVNERERLLNSAPYDTARNNSCDRTELLLN